MKQLLSMLISLGLFSFCQAQLKAKAKCPVFEVDIMDGKVNGLRPNRASSEIKSVLPCFTTSEDESTSSKCGGTVFYKDRDIYFYTTRDYIEIGPKFQGKLSVPLLGSKRGSLFRLLGHPKIKDDKWEAYQTGYGCLVLYYGPDNKCRKIQFSTKSTDALQLCE